ncbi:hypothetical protein ACIGB8_28135 [Promicromonospora sukumoe]|uniref:hypothetical protein n=1 Tax=Promicromonospora sukumoe TaxID=88382 RepID=UPI0037C9C1BE
MDPTAFLSTIASSAAALVAIVGGLLVARVISLATESGGLRDRRTELQGARDRARDRFLELDARVLEYDLKNCLSEAREDFLQGRTVSVPGLIDQHAPGRTLDQLGPRIRNEAVRIAAIREQLLPAFTDGPHFREWKEYAIRVRLAVPEVDEDDWDDVWEVLTEQNPPPFQSGMGLGVATPFRHLGPAPDRGAETSLRRDADNARIAHRDLEAETERADLALARVAEPRGVYAGLVVLGYVVLTGVVFPLALIALGLKSMERTWALVVLGVFVTGLAALTIYLWLEVRRLVRDK